MVETSSRIMIVVEAVAMEENSEIVKMVVENKFEEEVKFKKRIDEREKTEITIEVYFAFVEFGRQKVVRHAKCRYL